MTSEKKKKNEHEVFVDTTEEVLEKDNDIKDRINKLYGISNDEAKKEVREYSKEELYSARKKLVFLFGGVVLTGIIIIFLLINPFINKKENIKPPIDTENNEEDNNKDMYIGQLDLSLELVADLINRISFTYTDLQNVDLFALYNNEGVDIKDIPNNIKLYLLKRDVNFKEILDNNGIDEYIQTCDPNGLSIDKSEFDKLVSMFWGPNTILEYEDINYNYYIDYSNSKKITLTYNEDKYIVNCNDYYVSKDIVKSIEQKTVKAIGTENSIEIYRKVVFISYKGEIGVFKEPDFKTLITNDRKAQLEDYIDKADTYKYTFIKNEDNYYLSRIELVNEDN